MGAIARSASNLVTTSGVVLKGAINNDSFDNVTAFPSAIGDSITLISSQTASASASISFTTGLDSTYKAYKFVFSNIHPSSASTFQFNLSTDSGSNYNVTKTTTAIRAFHTESGVASGLAYETGIDLAQSTSFQDLATDSSGTNNDSGISGILHIFNPSSTTYVKHFMSNTNSVKSDNEGKNIYIAGYANTTSAVNAVQFKFSSGNIDDGKIYLYGIK